MIPTINRILYATDLSRNSAYAFRYAINSSRHHNADIIILHVLEPLSATAHALLSSYLDEEDFVEKSEEKRAYVMDRIRRRLDIFCEKELKDAPECVDRVASVEIVVGHPEEEILRKADELSCDIIVMGTHGKGGATHTFLGSVTKRVLRRVRKPVLIIPIPKETDIEFDHI